MCDGHVSEGLKRMGVIFQVGGLDGFYGQHSAKAANENMETRVSGELLRPTCRDRRLHLHIYPIAEPISLLLVIRP